MKWILLILGVLLLTCSLRNAPKKEAKETAALTLTLDPCDTLSVKLNYEAKEERFRTIDFAEGKDTFRIIPDTTGDNFQVYIQRKIGTHCWKTLEDVLECRQIGIQFLDWNDDGFVDLTNPLQWWTEVSLYNPVTKGFEEPIEVGCRILHVLPQKLRYDFVSKGPRASSMTSNLYRFEKGKMKVYAFLKMHYYPDSNNFEVEKIELYSVHDKVESFRQAWKPKDLPLFMKNNGSEDYFEHLEFAADYWKKNWSQFVAN